MPSSPARPRPHANASCHIFDFQEYTPGRIQTIAVVQNTAGVPPSHDVRKVAYRSRLSFFPWFSSPLAMNAFVTKGVIPYTRRRSTMGAPATFSKHFTRLLRYGYTAGTLGSAAYLSCESRVCSVDATKMAGRLTRIPTLDDLPFTQCEGKRSTRDGRIELLAVLVEKPCETSHETTAHTLETMFALGGAHCSEVHHEEVLPRLPASPPSRYNYGCYRADVCLEHKTAHRGQRGISESSHNPPPPPPPPRYFWVFDRRRRGTAGAYGVFHDPIYEEGRLFRMPHRA